MPLGKDRDFYRDTPKRRYVKKKKRNVKLWIILSIAAILALWGVVALFACRKSEEYFSKREEADKPASSSVSDTVATEPRESEKQPIVVTGEPDAPPTDIRQITVERSQIYKGPLILVSESAGREFDFEQEEDLIILYGNKSQSYKIASSNFKLNKVTFDAAEKMFNAFFEETGNCNYHIKEAHRTLGKQQELYDYYLKEYGTESGVVLPTKAGYSEHHTGYAFDLNVFDGQGSYTLDAAIDFDPVYNWIYEHAHEYGFILRYPESKKQITGISGDEWHFRYVGVGHSAYMKEYDLTLEEYIYLIYRHPIDGEHLVFEYGGAKYDVSFAKISPDADGVTVPVLKDAKCIISGDNSDGVIITQIY